jgi:hypothetical protein
MLMRIFDFTKSVFDPITQYIDLSSSKRIIISLRRRENDLSHLVPIVPVPYSLTTAFYNFQLKSNCDKASPCHNIFSKRNLSLIKKKYERDFYLDITQYRM